MCRVSQIQFLTKLLQKWTKLLVKWIMMIILKNLHWFSLCVTKQDRFVVVIWHICILSLVCESVQGVGRNNSPPCPAEDQAGDAAEAMPRHVDGQGWTACKYHLNFIPGGPPTNGTVDFQDFALINSYLFSPCWIEHLFLIIITPRSSNLVENFLFYE